MITISELQDVFRVRYKLGQVTPSDFKQWLASAIRLYNGYNPLVYREVITSVAGQSEYVLSNTPSYLRLVARYDETLGDVMTLTDSDPDRMSDSERPGDWVIDVINDTLSMKDYTPLCSLSGNNLVFPSGFASAGEKIEVVYSSPHALNTGETAYETIPGEDFDILLRLTLAEMLEWDAFQMGVTPDHTEGLGQMTVRYVVPNTLASVYQLRSALYSKYSRTPVEVA
jgi:hypothetical protein